MTNSHLYFQDISLIDQKTKRYIIRSTKDDSALGYIHWYTRWRRYVFMSYDSVFFDTECLKEIIEFIETLMEERKANANA